MNGNDKKSLLRIKVPIWNKRFLPSIFCLPISLEKTLDLSIWVEALNGQHDIWMFPKIGVPPNHPFLIGFSMKIHHPFGGYPYFWKHLYRTLCRFECQLPLQQTKSRRWNGRVSHLFFVQSPDSLSNDQYTLVFGMTCQTLV